MMTLIIAAALAGLAAPEPRDPNWITPEDYPMAELDARRQGTNLVEILVDPKGRPERCTLVSSTGNANLDRASCAVSMRRARFRPATDEQGRPAYGVYRKLTGYWIPDRSGLNRAPRIAPDMTLVVAKLPGDGPGPIIVDIVAMIDTAGVIRTCTGKPDEAAPKLAIVACGQLPSLWTPTAVKDDAGTAIAYARAFKVAFQTQAK